MAEREKMRKKELFGIVVILSAVSIGNILSVSADTSKYSDSTITLTAEGETDEPTDPLDPWNPNPDEWLEPESGDEVTGDKGRLRIDYVSNFKFPDTKINTVDQIVYAEVKTMNILDENGTAAGSKKLPNYAQISDYRGTGEGWTLKAKIGNFEYKDGSDIHVLNGAQVTLNNINTSNPAVDFPYITAFQSASAIALNGSDRIIMSGTGNNSKGSNLAYFGSRNNETEAGKSVALLIPSDNGKTLAQTYKAKITWTLEDTYTP